MLAMRNGLSLHPLSLPGGLQPVQLSQMRMDFGEEHRSLHPNMTGTLPMNQEASNQNIFAMPNQCTSSNNQQLVPNMVNIINSETTLGLESQIQAPLDAFQLQASSQVSLLHDPHESYYKFTSWSSWFILYKVLLTGLCSCHVQGICKEDGMRNQQTNLNRLEKSPLGLFPHLVIFFFLLLNSVTAIISMRAGLRNGALRTLMLPVSFHLVIIFLKHNFPMRNLR